MGRIKTTMIKQITKKVMIEHKDKIKKDFSENKLTVGQIIDVPSKKIRNLIAGYMTRLYKTMDR